jgi:hypothetical protein
MAVSKQVSSFPSRSFCHATCRKHRSVPSFSPYFFPLPTPSSDHYSTMPGIYGGDDISAIVLDAGSSSTRAGWAGEDTPRVVIPSSYGWLPGDVDLEAEAAATTNGNGEAMEGVETNETDATKTDASAEDGRVPTKKKAMSDWEVQKRRAENRHRFVGDSGVNSWRRNMEIGNPFEDDVCEFSLQEGQSVN